jgi:subtilase family serine protease
MVSIDRALLCSFLVIMSGIAHAANAQSVSDTAPAATRILQPIDESKLIRLRGNVHPGARAANDHGVVDPETPMNRIVLVLQRSPEQESALEQFMAEQYNPQSPNFHHWLSPEDFGATYGPSDADITTVTGWLQNHGFTIDRVSKGRVTIEFSGNAGQVAATFHTEIHRYVVNGLDHIANSSDPEIPEALAPVVEGVASLHNFFPKHQSVTGHLVRRDPQTGRITLVAKPPASALPQFTYTDENGDTREDITPYDFATIYNVLPVWNAGIKGNNQTIAISGAGDILLSDVATFQKSFGLPNNPPMIIQNGPDPGLNDGARGENTLDVEWSGAVAPAAKIVLVVTGSTETTFGGQLSDSYIVDNKTASIMSASYGLCELEIGTSGNAALNSIWQQGAAEGVSIFESAGDQGSAGCSSQDVEPPNADTVGLAVNGMASSPYVTAVGGTDFLWQTVATGTYWNSTNSASGATAKGYVPEIPWNSTCTSSYIVSLSGYANAEAFCNAALDGDGEDFVVIAAGSGGVSRCTAPTGTDASSCAGGYAKPSWQAGTGVPSDGKRDLPDVSLFASAGYPDGVVGSAYLVCITLSTSTCDYTSAGGVEYQEVGGTSVSSPAMAGIAALVQQKTGEAQGLINPVLYSFAASENLAACSSSTVANGNNCIFYDTTSGTNTEVCISGDRNCDTVVPGDAVGVLSGYNAGAGYDLATGLGSVNVANLVNAAWPTSAGTPSVSVTPSTIAFGNETVGSKTSSAIILKNTSSVAVAISSIATTGANLVSFTQSNNCPSSLSAAASCTVTVTFDPTGAQSKSAAVTIIDAAGMQSVPLTGTGVSASSIVVSPTTIAFGNQTVGMKSAAKPITVQNNTTSAVAISSIAMTGANTVSFTQTNNCPSSLAVSATCTVQVTFDPTSAVAKSASVTVTFSGGTQVTTLTGTGVAPAISLSPSSLAFGNQTVGVKSGAKAVTVRNNSASGVPISSVVMTGANTVSFTETNNCPSSLAASATCTVEVTFDPTSAVAKSADVTVSYGGISVSAPVTGTGVN